MQPHIKFTWKAPTTRTDGTPLTQSEINSLEFLLFESGTMIIDGIGQPTFNLLMEDEEEGQKAFTVAARQYGLTGPQSEPRIVNFIAPAAPTDLDAEWVAGSETGSGE